jgi:hypothetical protein
MVKRPWHERLRDELAKRGLPPAYATRLIEELAEHWADIEEESPGMTAPESAEEKLGSPERLAAVAAREVGRQTFAGRHPFATFVLSPLAATALFFVVIVLIGRAWAWLLVPRQVHAPTTLERVSAFVEVSLLCLTPFLLAWLFLELSRRVARPVWGLFAGGLLAFLALNFSPTVLPGLEVYFSLGGFLSYRPDRLIQSALPVMLCLWAWWRIHYPAENSTWGGEAASSTAPKRG